MTDVASDAINVRHGCDELDHLAVDIPMIIDVIDRYNRDGEQVVTQAAEVRPLDLMLVFRPHAGPVVGVVLDPAKWPVVDALIINRRHTSVEYRSRTTGPDGCLALA